MHVVEHPPTPLPWSLALNLFHVRKCSVVGVGPAVEPVEDNGLHIVKDRYGEPERGE
jgi:hypothetical protein